MQCRLIVSSVSRSHIQFLPEAQDDPQRRRPDIRKAKMLLGWEPVVSSSVVECYWWLLESILFMMFICMGSLLKSFIFILMHLADDISQTVFAQSAGL